ncbi:MULTISPECIES: lipoteichoic acid biosynthesis MFS flippase LtaA [Staphylococcus]|jgi:MFS family permease|uniref:Proton-coupled antiporter flippase LtaA n=6 Tax=Staphylococcus haemolyticus TaxID=1283 RepID=LTAA_STAHJ|nr:MULTISPECIES: MFS transporter [Staphylococcus]Q4L523.2 RecName: Full=Proton-coupled antiporter flippase LtaA; AltName: Full=Lipoteichoic acid protein A [Staphylococcus haemolyticus JCSC1435]AKC76662.1 MFS family major facilitator transporter [Staphylococcus haemolyticus]AMW23016.1 MFS transporter [Staphylococcus haemolyticus]KQC17078.1 MFS transporter [Staphylococcus haemolyticus]MBC3014200.1 MFS transporter [Staphylococcus haemolyticus]MBC3104679.1 MFS transporter [Staphylococcus haemolyt
MPDSSLSNKGISKNFKIMLVILFLMEFARGMYVLSYVNYLPTVTSIAVAVTSAALSIHFISDAATNFVIGFLLKKFGTKLVLTLGFLLAFISLFLVIWFPTNPIVIILSAIMLGIAVSPIWVIMLSSVEEAQRGKQMGYVYFAWLLGLLVGWAFMNVLVKLHPTRFAFMMSLVVVIAWVLYYFVDIKLTNYNTKPVSEQLGQIVDVMKRHLVLFPGILLQGASISALLPILPTYATKVVGVSTIEYTIAIAIGGAGCAFSMLFLSKIIDKNSKGFMYAVIFTGFILFTAFIFGLSLVTNILIVWIVAIFIGLMYGILLPAWNTFMAGQIDPAEQEETWGVFNSVQGFGSMIGPLFGGLIAQFSNGLNNTFYFSAAIFLVLAIFYGVYFVKYRGKANRF